ncbi:hypothetical protein PAV_14c00620 [Paenibacillus alvei DSM 29]|nr:hypothetical protein PAV_14c00620 [Paenibacillus alvei DSM 29]
MTVHLNLYLDFRCPLPRPLGRPPLAPRKVGGKGWGKVLSKGRLFLPDYRNLLLELSSFIHIENAKKYKSNKGPFIWDPPIGGQGL